ncbi:MAG TPA: hypothetical protein VLB76_03340 [Thermoanaerobaculia bacterium]|jgi:hypothetical protein|nr:hypothetical protein [Thermoanaerobaculia bacterium]
MQSRTRSLALGLIAGVALTLAAVAQDTTGTTQGTMSTTQDTTQGTMGTTGTGTGVTFVNGSNRRIDVYTQYGSDASCGSKPEAKRITIDAGQSGVLDSGSSKACFCLKVPNRGTCPSGGWTEVKAGATRRLM